MNSPLQGSQSGLLDPDETLGVAQGSQTDARRWRAPKPNDNDSSDRVQDT
jgi:hypothetical protein